MLRFTTLFSVITLMSLSLWTAGCGSKGYEETDATSSEGEHDESGHGDHDDGDHDHGDHDHGDHDHGAAADPEKIAANLAKLSAEDRTAAEKQKICPVTEDLLGMMGAPIKLDVKGQTVFLCCKGCKKKILADPETYLAKLGGSGDHGEHDHEGHE